MLSERVDIVPLWLYFVYHLTMENMVHTVSYDVIYQLSYIIIIVMTKLLMSRHILKYLSLSKKKI